MPGAWSVSFPTGYRNGSLQSLFFRTPYGTCTPDFLVLKRKSAPTPY